MGGSSSSKQESLNADNRVAVQDGIGLSSSNGNNITSTNQSWLNITTTDNGLVSRGLDTVDRNNAAAFQIVDSALDHTSDNFTKLLEVQASMWNDGQNLMGQMGDRVADAYNLAQTDAKGTIDNKTIVVLGVVAAAALVMSNRK